MTFHVHPLFWMIMLFALLTGQFVQVITLFMIVLIHEAGHVAAGLAYGWRVRKIELLPFGGVAEVDEWGNTRPVEEIVVALAGPLMNGVLITVGYFLQRSGLWAPEWAAFFMYGNVAIGGFNLLPIWPLDGGRILHTVCSLTFTYRTSIYVSIASGLIGSLFIFIWSIRQSSPQLNGVAVACYLFFSNIMSYRQMRFQFLRFLLARYQRIDKLKNLPVRKVRVNRQHTLFEITKKLKRGRYHSFLVNDRAYSAYQAISEQEILTYYFTKTPHCAVELLLR
ncbi:M50 family metallopeptidase [Aneurinibacillus terranovensis]|uniref:M50 family metallopeptidase n=1 Tax=Aneurinibacillus terranovensis TaxID=278991 RepID=UPI0012DD40FB|nr:M50 family metallopeptidase [Aneurinibacillus terranovensis]